MKADREKVFAALGGEQAARETLLDLAADKRDQKVRMRMCRMYGGALERVGRVLWVQGSIVGPDRAAGTSPQGFGNDDVVGLATVCQVGGELAKGTISLFNAGNEYAAMALIRQLVEVEYLASAFAEQDRIAADWIRADRKQRLAFWSPTKLRKRSHGRYLREDYWDHCDRGGHPTAEALDLLPDHEPRLATAFHWADLAGHLHGTWLSVVKAIEARPHAVVLPEDVAAQVSEVAEAAEVWLEQDKLTVVLRSLHGQIRRAPNDPPPQSD